MLQNIEQGRRTSRSLPHSDELPSVDHPHNPSFAGKCRSRSPLPDVRVACNFSCLILLSNMIPKWSSICNNVDRKRKLTSLVSQITIIADTTDFSGGNPSDESFIPRRVTRAAARLVFFEVRRFTGMLSTTSVRRAWGEAGKDPHVGSSHPKFGIVCDMRKGSSAVYTFKTHGGINARGSANIGSCVFHAYSSSASLNVDTPPQGLYNR